MEIKEALESLDPNHAGHWTGEGAPRVDVVSAIVGRQLNRIDIENAWPEFDRAVAAKAAESETAGAGETDRDTDRATDGDLQVPDGARIEAGDDHLPLPKNYRCWLYHAHCPNGQLFQGAREVADALQQGWVDHPGKIRDPSSGG